MTVGASLPKISDKTLFLPPPGYQLGIEAYTITITVSPSSHLPASTSPNVLLYTATQ